MVVLEVVLGTVLTVSLFPLLTSRLALTMRMPDISAWSEAGGPG